MSDSKQTQTSQVKADPYGPVEEMDDIPSDFADDSRWP
jgi:hypothetical protein